MKNISTQRLVASTLLLLTLVAGGCKLNRDAGDRNSANAKVASNSTKPDADGVMHSGAGEEKEKPEAGKANVQGKVLFNDKPASGIDVKLCEKFSQFLSGCGGQTFTTKTDSNGEYLIKNVPPGIYEGLTAKVFDTPYYVFATSGIVSSAKYKLEPDATFFAPDTHLFKSDLRLLNPKAAAKVKGEGIEVKWESYPDAAYYKFSIHADSSTAAKTEYDFINKRVDGTSFVLDKPLTPGGYSIKVTAYNSNDRKLAESSSDIKFTVTQ